MRGRHDFHCIPVQVDSVEAAEWVSAEAWAAGAAGLEAVVVSERLVV